MIRFIIFSIFLFYKASDTANCNKKIDINLVKFKHKSNEKDHINVDLRIRVDEIIYDFDGYNIDSFTNYHEARQISTIENDDNYVKIYGVIPTLVSTYYDPEINNISSTVIHKDFIRLSWSLSALFMGTIDLSNIKKFTYLYKDIKCDDLKSEVQFSTIKLIKISKRGEYYIQPIFTINATKAPSDTTKYVKVNDLYTTDEGERLCKERGCDKFNF